MQIAKSNPLLKCDAPAGKIEADWYLKSQPLASFRPITVPDN
jgi:hypothetical protein